MLFDLSVVLTIAQKLQCFASNTNGPQNSDLKAQDGDQQKIQDIFKTSKENRQNQDLLKVSKMVFWIQDFYIANLVKHYLSQFIIIIWFLRTMIYQRTFPKTLKGIGPLGRELCNIFRGQVRRKIIKTLKERLRGILWLV